jgi:RNA recognition motif-containing protein
MAKRLFVGGLSFSTTSSQLEGIFSKIGKVISCNVIKNRDTGQSKGFGFIEMENDKEADEAIEKLNDTELEGKKIVVNVAKPRVERPRFDNRGGGPRGGGRR